MKQFLTTLLLIIAINVCNVHGQAKSEVNASLDPSQVPVAAVHSFTYENPGMSGTWRNDAANFRVNYIDPESKLGRIIVYDKNGNVVRRENEVDNVTYPKQINEYYNKKHPGETYQVWSSEDKRNGNPLYYSSRNAETIWFDKDGNVVPEKKANKAVEKNK